MMVIVMIGLFLQVGFDGWGTLGKVKVETAYDSFLGEEMDMPKFSEELKAWGGKRVTLSGYVIPLGAGEEEKYFVLSRFPFNNCFFCGNAGPETVMEVYASDKITLQDMHVQVTGILKLNSTDPLHLFYVLSEAEVKVLD